MSEHEPAEHANDDPSKADREQPSRPAALTAEQRRLLGKPRPVHERVEAEKETINEAAPAHAGTAKGHGEETPGFGRTSDQPHVAAVRIESDAPSSGGGKRVAVTLGVLAALLLTFYVGKKFDYWRYLWMVRNKPKLGEQIPDKFPGVPASELVEQALDSEHANHLSDAAERLIAAKHKDLRYRGVLFRAGKLAYDAGNFDTADRLFDRALAFGENVDESNYLRGLIAKRQGDLVKAQHFFEAATTAEPFVANYYYYWGEVLRLDHHPREAIMRYEQAARRARDDQDQAVCQFKVRMARLEAGEDEQLKAEIERERSVGPLSLDWLLTEAGVAIGDSRIDDAVRSITAARAAIPKTENGGGIFLSCTSDVLFQNASKLHPLVADACDFKGTSP